MAYLLQMIIKQNIFSPLQVILVGEYGVGKSSLFRRFATDSFVSSSDRASTIGLDNFGKVYSVGGEEEGRAVKLQLWDTGGMERVARCVTEFTVII